MKSRNIWPESIAFLIILLVAWGLLKLTPIPANTVSLLTKTPPASTLTPTPTPAPPAGAVYLTFTVEEIAQWESFSGDAFFEQGPVPSRMVVVAKQTTVTQDGGSVTVYNSEEFCVAVDAFLNKDGVRLPGYNSETAKKILVTLQVADLARYGAAFPEKVQFYLAPDPACSTNS